MMTGTQGCTHLGDAKVHVQLVNDLTLFFWFLLFYTWWIFAPTFAVSMYFLCFYFLRWLKSEAKKDGVDAEISKYDGESL